ncbi:hypothetical protein ACK249_006285 [Pseudomonas aeruginosa]|uniref:hypothetical protein n=1 Tax=Pseudomonas aeruginosa TaxID=287 RepID=UPI00155E49A0|nr:hypothetical protein [Pseudomonas aeruginosa]EKW9641599.1 hypothetical protein [Pseudomonas aeruginosa]NRC33897.1 hypothetical protein [Pseudomonas aeruginosa]
MQARSKISLFAACVASFGTLALVLWLLKPEHGDQIDYRVIHLDSPTCIITLPNGEILKPDDQAREMTTRIPKGTQITGGCFKTLLKQQ